MGELIDRHGRENWLDPFIDQLGPYIQLQLGDLADFIEILAKSVCNSALDVRIQGHLMLTLFHSFYAWKSPLKTVSTLVFFTACLAVSIFGDTKFNLRIVYFVAGGAFFFCWPIASRYPQYRFLVSPLRWVFWDVPTHGKPKVFSFLQEASEVQLLN